MDSWCTVEILEYVWHCREAGNNAALTSHSEGSVEAAAPGSEILLLVKAPRLAE